MAVEVISKIKPKNNGSFKIADAVDVEYTNGSYNIQTVKEALDTILAKGVDSAEAQSIIQLINKFNGHLVGGEFVVDDDGEATFTPGDAGVIKENLWDKDNVVHGYYLKADGTSSANTQYCYSSDYIPVYSGQQLTIAAKSQSIAPYIRFVTAYDSSKKVVSSLGMSDGNTVYTVPDGVSYVKLTIEDQFTNVFVYVKDIHDEFVRKPIDASGLPTNGTAGQALVSMGNGTTQWATLSSGSSSGATTTTTTTSGRFYYADDNGVTPSAADNTAALQSLVDKIWQAGGGTILFGTGVYKFKNVNMRSQVSLKGQGMGATILRRIDGGTLKGFIFFPKYSTAGDVRDMTLVGIDMTTLSNGRMGTEYFPTGYFKVDGMSGIYYETTNDKSSSFSNGDRYWSVHGLITAPRVFTENDSVTYKFANILNILVIGFPAYGLYMGHNTYAFMVDNINLESCGCNMLCLSSDTIISNVLSEGAAYSGMLLGGGNLKVSNIKSIWNGKWTTVADRTCPFAKSADFKSGPTSDLCWGVQIAAFRSSITNVEAQDNYCHGIFINGDDASATGIVSDSNGLVCSNPRNNWQGNEMPKDCTGIMLKGTRAFYQVKTCNYNYGSRPKPAKISLHMDWVRWSTVYWSDQPDENAGNVADDPANGNSRLSVTPFISSTCTETMLNGKKMS